MFELVSIVLPFTILSLFPILSSGSFFYTDESDSFGKSDIIVPSFPQPRSHDNGRRSFTTEGTRQK